MYTRHAALTYLMRILFSIIMSILITSCFTNKKIDDFYIYYENKEIFKLSIERENILELQKVINHFDHLTEKTVNNPPMEVDLKPGFFTKYSLVGKDSSGMKVIDHRFVKGKPFCLYYMVLDHSYQFPYPLVDFYSIDRFFSPEERRTMEMHIPEWKKYEDHESN